MAENKPLECMYLGYSLGVLVRKTTAFVERESSRPPSRHYLRPVSETLKALDFAVQDAEALGKVMSKVESSGCAANAKGSEEIRKTVGEIQDELRHGHYMNAQKELHRLNYLIQNMV